MVIVSHDREHLDKVCNKIVEVLEGRCYKYDGNYSRFLKQKTAMLASWEKRYEQQQRRIKEERQYVRVNKKDESKTATVRQKERLIEKLTTGDEAIPKPPRPDKFKFRFPPPPRCAETVLRVEGVRHGYGEGQDTTLFRDVNLEILRGQRVGFIGPNGVGKSTLLRLLVGTEKPMEGKVDFGSSNVIVGYFEQNQADALDLDKTVLQTIQESAPPDFGFTEVRALLGRFKFTGDAVEKKVGVLSGGEKARVALCKMMLTPANLLVMDEPGNHVDLPAKEMLEEALQHFEGAVLLISHDRYLMSNVATRIVSMRRGEPPELFEGDYRMWLDAQPDLSERVDGRVVEGVEGIRNARIVEVDEVQSKKKTFGGKGASGNRFKKIKNAKRYDV